MHSGEVDSSGAGRWYQAVRAWEARAAAPREALAVATAALHHGPRSPEPTAGASRVTGPEAVPPDAVSDPRCARFVARSARAAALSNLEEWNETRAEVERALTELKDFVGAEPDMGPGDLEPRAVPSELAPYLTETLLVGLRSASLSSDVAAALPFGHAALKTAAYFDLPNLEARAHNELASLYGRRDFHERAFHHLRAGVEVLEQAGLPVLPQLLTNLGNLYMHGHRHVEALGCFQRGREGFERAGDAFGAAVARSNEGRLLVLTGQPEQGLTALREALDSFVALDRPAFVGVTLGKMGTAQAGRDDCAAAERCFEEALATFGAEERPFRGEVHESYGEFLLDRGRGEEALRQFEAAEQHYRLAGADGAAAGLVRYQSKALEALGRYREAYEQLVRHLDLTEQLDRERGAVILEVMLVELEAGLAKDHELQALTTRVLSEANKSLRDQAERLERISSTDELTELFNRRYLNRRLREEIARAASQGGEVSLILFDVDSFKAVNDRHSHLIGDEVLKKVASVLKGTVRRSDAVARWGGEEFAVLLPGTDKDAALLVAEKARTAVAAADWSSLAPALPITVSAGVATASEVATDVEGMGMLKLADRRLYRAKHAGRNRTTAD